MALRNYLYAKHDTHVDISTRINKVAIPEEANPSRMSSSAESISQPTRYGHSVPKSFQHRHPQDDTLHLSQMVNKVAQDLNDISIAGKKCTKSCSSCKCGKENGVGSDELNGTISPRLDEPSLKVEVAENEMDFTNAL
ncbi:hypothetical protein KGF57_001502 [Candida theae]|uniref:Uncharacterized protein n=1 Tax=Candida theae TaxID=1198502 RepID=A0AAD5FZV9_9ASCO|nr:uncharacterized protein KGF57_001502 [Candida theae]KAI5962057.1 hypothetical protein KGF57_001502 [Candida theae]